MIWAAIRRSHQGQEPCSVKRPYTCLLTTVARQALNSPLGHTPQDKLGGVLDVGERSALYCQLSWRFLKRVADDGLRHVVRALDVLSVLRNAREGIERDDVEGEDCRGK